MATLKIPPTQINIYIARILMKHKFKYREIEEITGIKQNYLKQIKRRYTDNPDLGTLKVIISQIEIIIDNHRLQNVTQNRLPKVTGLPKVTNKFSSNNKLVTTNWTLDKISDLNTYTVKEALINYGLSPYAKRVPDLKRRLSRHLRSIGEL